MNNNNKVSKSKCTLCLGRRKETNFRTVLPQTPTESLLRGEVKRDKNSKIKTSSLFLVPMVLQTTEEPTMNPKSRERQPQRREEKKITTTQLRDTSRPEKIHFLRLVKVQSSLPRTKTLRGQTPENGERVLYPKPQKERTVRGRMQLTLPHTIISVLVKTTSSWRVGVYLFHGVYQRTKDLNLTSCQS